MLISFKNGVFFGGEFGVAVHEVGLCTRWDRLLLLTFSYAMIIAKCARLLTLLITLIFAQTTHFWEVIYCQL